MLKGLMEGTGVVCWMSLIGFLFYGAWSVEHAPENMEMNHDQFLRGQITKLGAEVIAGQRTIEHLVMAIKVLAAVVLANPNSKLDPRRHEQIVNKILAAQTADAVLAAVNGRE